MTAPIAQITELQPNTLSVQATVALNQGAERAANLRQTIEQVIDQIDWQAPTHVLIKPNLVKVECAIANTHREALATVLACVRDRYQGRLTVAEGCAVSATGRAFALHRYADLAQQYGAALLDLNDDAGVDVCVLDRHAKPMQLQIARTALESDCRISLSLPKTHDAVIATASIKNIIMGSLVNRRLAAQGCRRAYWLDRLGQMALGHGNGWGSDKVAMHQPYPIMNINLALLAPLLWPHLSILDGFVAMEGAGPIEGEPVHWGIALAGADALAVDSVAVRHMGFEVAEIGYLHYCAQMELGVSNPAQIALVGNVDTVRVQRSFRRHPTHAAQSQWHHPRSTELLQTVVR